MQSRFAGAAALLSELGRVHGVVAKQGMMGALSGFEWLDRLKAVRRLPAAVACLRRLPTMAQGAGF